MNMLDDLESDFEGTVKRMCEESANELTALQQSMSEREFDAHMLRRRVDGLAKLMSLNAPEAALIPGVRGFVRIALKMWPDLMKDDSCTTKTAE